MCHLIFVCKYRKKLLIRYDKEIKQIFYDVAEENDFNIVEMEAYNKAFNAVKDVYQTHFECGLYNED